MKRKFITSCWLIIALFAMQAMDIVADEAKFSCSFRNADKGKLIINGFVVNAEDEMEHEGKNLSTCLKKGENKIVALNKGGVSEFSVSKKESGEKTVLFSSSFRSSDSIKVKNSFYLPDYPYTWSWEKSEPRTVYNTKERKRKTKVSDLQILEVVEKYVNAYKSGKWDKDILTLMKYQLIDVKNQKKLKSPEEAFKAFKGFYAMMLAPEVRKSFTVPKEKLRIEENDNIIRVKRADNAPLFQIIDSSDSKFTFNEIYLIIIDGKLYVI